MDSVAVLQFYQKEARTRCRGRLGSNTPASRDDLRDALLSWLLEQNDPRGLIEGAGLNQGFQRTLLGFLEEQDAVGIRFARSRDLVYTLRQQFQKELFGEVSVNNSVEDNIPWQCRVAVVDDHGSARVASAIWYACNPTPDYQGYAYVDVLFTLPDFRGNGLGGMLLNDLEHQMPESVDIIVLHAPRSALEFYRREGFEDSGHVCNGRGQMPIGEMMTLDDDALFRIYRAKAST